MSSVLFFGKIVLTKVNFVKLSKEHREPESINDFPITLEEFTCVIHRHSRDKMEVLRRESWPENPIKFYQSL